MFLRFWTQSSSVTEENNTLWHGVGLEIGGFPSAARWLEHVFHHSVWNSASTTFRFLSSCLFSLGGFSFTFWLFHYPPMFFFLPRVTSSPLCFHSEMTPSVPWMPFLWILDESCAGVFCRSVMAAGSAHNLVNSCVVMSVAVCLCCLCGWRCESVCLCRGYKQFLFFLLPFCWEIPKKTKQQT